MILSSITSIIFKRVVVRWEEITHPRIRISMAEWERTAFTKCTNFYVTWMIFLIFFSFNEFVAILNSHQPQIKLKCNLQSVKFLDTEVFFTPVLGGVNKRLATKVYFKATDRHTLLHKTSYHPQHTYHGLIKAQLICFHSICTYPDDVEEATQRGYSKRFLRNITTEVAVILKNHTVYKRAEESLPLIPMVETFSHHLGKCDATLRANLKQAQEADQPLTGFRIITAHRRNKKRKGYVS